MEQLHSIAVREHKVQLRSQYKSMKNMELDHIFSFTYLVLYKQLTGIDCEDHELQKIGKLSYVTLAKKLPKFLKTIISDSSSDE